MRFLADEDVPLAAVEALRADGHDVVWVRTELPGSSDDVVLARARTEVGVLLTFDAELGERVLGRGAEASVGVVVFRVPVALPLTVAQSVASAIAARSDWQGQFSVVEVGHVRMRPLPP